MQQLVLFMLVLLPGCSDDRELEHTAPVSVESGAEVFMSAAVIAPPGQALYVANCMPCHGRGGRGDGPVVLHLPFKPRDFVAEAWQHILPDEAEADGISRIVASGIPEKGMQSFRETLSEQERTEIAHYVLMLRDTQEH